MRKLEKKIIDKKVEIKSKVEIKNIEMIGNKFLITLDSEVLEADELVWTLSSGLLNKFIPTGIIGKKPNFRIWRCFKLKMG